MPCLLTAALPLMIAAPAVAQNAGAASPSSDNGGLEEIVVTAQRKSENVLRVPVSISAATGEQLVAAGITQISSLQFTTPGFYTDNGVGYTQIYLRGIGNNIFVGADPSVLTNIDDVPRIYGSMVNNFVNVDRVEVLKGAQGGLYGRNATGGVVNIITRQPGDTEEADARVSYGTKNTLQVALYANLPINEFIAWNVAFQRDSHDNYVKNLLPNNPLTAANVPQRRGLPAGLAAQLWRPAHARRDARTDRGLFQLGDQPAKRLRKPGFLGGRHQAAAAVCTEFHDDCRTPIGPRSTTPRATSGSCRRPPIRKGMTLHSGGFPGHHRHSRRGSSSLQPTLSRPITQRPRPPG